MDSKEQNKKLNDRCSILEKIVDSISNIYDNEANDDQKRLIETVIGAAIWYLPHGDKYWTGYISEKAIEALRKNNLAKLTKEHQYPRKLSAKEILNKKMSNNILKEMYEEKYAKFNYVTPEENKKIANFQKEDVFVDVETAYKSAGIELKEISFEEIKQLRSIKNK